MTTPARRTDVLPPADLSIPAERRVFDPVHRARIVFGFSDTPAPYRDGMARRHVRMMAPDDRARLLNRIAPLEDPAAAEAYAKIAAAFAPHSILARKAANVAGAARIKAERAAKRAAAPVAEIRETRSPYVVPCACGCGDFVPASSHRPRVAYVHRGHRPAPKRRKAPAEVAA